MKSIWGKKALLLVILLHASLHAHSHEKRLFFFAQKVPQGAITHTSYRIKIGAFKHLKNALKKQAQISINTYILKGEKFYSLYIATYHDKDHAKRALKVLQQTYHDAYIVTTYEILTSESKEDFYTMGIKAFQRGEYESALALFDKEMILHPENKKAALEYARTLYMLGFYKQAKIEFLKILALNPPQNVRKNIKNFLEKISIYETKNHFYGILSLGITYDDNLGFTTSSPTLQYGGLTLENNTTKTKGIYNTLNLFLAHRYQGESFTWENRFYSYNELQHQATIDAVNYLSYNSILSKNYDNFDFALSGTINQTWFAQKRDHLSLITQPTIRYKFSLKSYLESAVKLERAYYSHDKERDYDRIGTQLSIVKFYDHLWFSLTGGYEEDSAIKKKRFDISQNRIYGHTMLHYPLFKEGELSFSYRYEKNSYDDIDPALMYAREDTKNLLSLAFKQYFKKNHAYTIGYNYLNNDSNINSFSYRKNSYSLHYHYAF